MVFNVKKLLKDGVDLTLWVGVKISEPGEVSFRFSDLGHRRQMCQRRCLSNAFETAFGPLIPEDLSWQKNHL